MRKSLLGLALATSALLLSSASVALAEVKLPAIFTSHMVLQQGQKNPVWGLAAAGEKVVVTIGDQKHEATAGADGKWKVALEALPVGGPHKLTIAGANTITLEDVLVGEVWVCAGQSNMQWSINNSNDPDLERAAAKFPNIRLITVPNVGTQEPQFTFNGQWRACTPETVGGFSAVGYFFGRQIHQSQDVPVGLINLAWGGSACECWVRRDILSGDKKYEKLMERWATIEKEQAANAGVMNGNQRPANIYNGVLKPVLGYGVRGAIWYQGETNANRAYQYRDLFPLMIQSWRDEWAQGDFPFYWVQLADFYGEKPEPADSAWAELREAQTMTQDKLKNTGEAVIIDIGEGKDIHPKNKVDVGRRLARMALKDVYNRQDIADRSPRYESMEKAPGKIVLKFKGIANKGQWRPFDVNELRGFAIAGEDKKFVNAKANMLDDGRIEVMADAVMEPAAVRYAWGDNPIVNLFHASGLPLTPFRTDDWPGVTINNLAP